MPSTTNFGWTTPADTDYVKDGASAIRTLANGVDTSMAQLKGGTTGQVLSKTNGTDMSFTWVTPQVGDITSVTATSPLTGGGTTGDVTVAIQSASTTQSGAVQLTDSTSSTSTTTAATPNSVKTAYDLANAAIAKSLVDAKGDLIVASADNTVARLAVGTNGQILTADSTATNGIKWASASTTTLPTFGAYHSGTAQSISANTTTKITFNAETFDPDNTFDSTTNYRFTPGVAGYYNIQISAGSNGSSAHNMYLYIYKNGSANCYLYIDSQTYPGANFSRTLYLNTTDYIEGYVRLSATNTIESGDASCFISGAGFRS